MIVCSCHGVTDRRIRAEVDHGALTVEAMGRQCGAGTNCGGCIPLIEEIIDDQLMLVSSVQLIAS